MVTHWPAESSVLDLAHYASGDEAYPFVLATRAASGVEVRSLNIDGGPVGSTLWAYEEYGLSMDGGGGLSEESTFDDVLGYHSLPTRILYAICWSLLAM